jgi:hypothetical protein
LPLHLIASCSSVEAAVLNVCLFYLLQAADTKWRNIIGAVQRQPLVIQVSLLYDKIYQCLGVLIE